MNKELYDRLHNAIEDFIDGSCEESLWDGWIHETLVDEMATAAAQVFDASMNGQKFAKQENP